jgi:prepilin-type N-terminal cleavage/methylation domain-containing protein/prepilin-type processing-associated H-X9-DG protein
MKRLSAREAFTLIELLVVIAVIAILASMLVGPAPESREKARATFCLFNLKQTGVAFADWQSSHNGLFPMGVSAADGGTRDFVEGGSAIVHFQTLTNSKNPVVSSEAIPASNGKNYRLQSVTNFGIVRSALLCPSDFVRRESFQRKTNVGELSDANISYLVGVDARSKDPASLLAADRNVAINGQSTTGLVVVAKDSSVTWAKGNHSSLHKGSILFGDGHVQFTKEPGSSTANDTTSYRLAIP